MSKMAKEFAEKYLKEELNSRLKHLGGQPDALCQAYQAALEAMAPKKKCYVFTVETRDAQAYLEPACIPPSDEDECSIKLPQNHQHYQKVPLCCCPVPR